MCFYIVLDSLAASYIGWPTSRFVEVITFNTAKVRNNSCASKFWPSNWGDFQHKIAELMFSTSSLLTLGRVHASMALHSLNRSLETNRRSSLSRLLPKGRKNFEASNP